jgi:hypothetical protein
MALPPVLKPGSSGETPTQLLARRRTQQREVSQFYARRYMRMPLVPQGAAGVGPVETGGFEKVVLQKDFLNVVGGVDSQSNGLVEVEVTRDVDGGMRFYADVDVHVTCKNTTAGTLTKGTPVYVTGSVGATTTVEIAAADAGDPSKMPAIGLLEQDLAPNEFGRTIAVGVLPGLNTLGYAINQTAYVAVGGGLTGTRPTASTALVQNIGRVLRVNGSNGEILVLGAGRTNDVPNYPASVLLGRGAASGAGPSEAITVGSGLLLTGTTLSATGGGGGSGTSGYTEIDFGAFPGGSDAKVTVTGQTGILATSTLQAWLVAQSTIDHTADEHRVETISVTCGNIVANTSFDIYAQNTSQLNEPVTDAGISTFRSAAATVYGYAGNSIGGRGTRIYGAWTVHWRWS